MVFCSVNPIVGSVVFWCYVFDVVLAFMNDHIYIVAFTYCLDGGFLFVLFVLVGAFGFWCICSGGSLILYLFSVWCRSSLLVFVKVLFFYLIFVPTLGRVWGF